MRPLILTLAVAFGPTAAIADVVPGLPTQTISLPGVEGPLVVQKVQEGLYRIADAAHEIKTNVRIQNKRDPSLTQTDLENIDSMTQKNYVLIEGFALWLDLNLMPIDGKSISRFIAGNDSSIVNPPRFIMTPKVEVLLEPDAVSRKPKYLADQGTPEQIAATIQAEIWKTTLNKQITNYTIPIDLRHLNPLALDLFTGKARIKLYTSVEIAPSKLNGTETLTESDVSALFAKLSQLPFSGQTDREKAVLLGSNLYRAAKNSALVNKVESFDSGQWDQLVLGLTGTMMVPLKALSNDDIRSLAVSVQKKDPNSGVFTLHILEGAYAN